VVAGAARTTAVIDARQPCSSDLLTGVQLHACAAAVRHGAIWPAAVDPLEAWPETACYAAVTAVASNALVVGVDLELAIDTAGCTAFSLREPFSLFSGSICERLGLGDIRKFQVDAGAGRAGISRYAHAAARGSGPQRPE
jgi:hypothetical protein